MTRPRSFAWAKLLTLALLCSLALHPTHAEDPVPATNIIISDYAFSPASLTVAKGTLVTWINRDQTPHNVLARDKAFRSPALDTNESYSRRFDTAGSYEYICMLHPHMTGKIEVTP